MTDQEILRLSRRVQETAQAALDADEAVQKAQDFCNHCRVKANAAHEGAAVARNELLSALVRKEVLV